MEEDGKYNERKENFQQTLSEPSISPKCASFSYNIKSIVLPLKEKKEISLGSHVSKSSA